MELQPGFIQKMERSRLRLLFQLPLALSAPVITYVFFPHLSLAAYTFATLAQYAIIAKTFDSYSKMLRAVKSIDYKAETHKLELKKYTFPLLQEKLITMEPEEIEKISKQLFNSRCTYQRVSDGRKLDTEKIGMWHDKQFFDSIILRKERQPARKRKDKI